MKMTILDTILEQIDKTRLQKLIDNPLDQCLSNFSHSIPEELSYDSAHKYLVELYQHIQLNGILPSLEISNEKASEEIIWILESNYRGYETKGYEGFLFDFMYGDNERRQIVFAHFMEIFKNIEREKHLSCVFKSKIDPLDWNQKHKLVREILHRYSNRLPPHLLSFYPEQLVPELEEIIKMI